VSAIEELITELARLPGIVVLASPASGNEQRIGEGHGPATIRGVDDRATALADDSNERLELGDLYRTKGSYTYSSGWNWRAVLATLIGCTLAWIGLVVPPLRPLYDYAWFVGFAIAYLVYLLLRKTFPKK